VTLNASGLQAAPFIALARRVEERCLESQSSGPSITIEE